MKIDFGSHTIDRKVEWMLEGVWDIFPWLITINRKLDNVLTTQADLDARAERIEAANVVIAAEVQALKDQVAAGTPAADLDFTRLDAAISGEESVEPAPAAPVEDTPVESGPAGITPSS